MQCTYRQFTFDTDAMRAFPTGQESMPTIYATETGLCFLEMSRLHWDKPKIRNLAPTEARRLAQLYGMEELLEHLRATRGHAVRVPEGAGILGE